MTRRALLAAALLAACGSEPARPPSHSTSIAVSADGRRVYVVNPDSDSVSVVDAEARTLISEVLLTGALPEEGADGTFTPTVTPRTLALAPDQRTLFVAGQRSGRLYAIDTRSFRVRVGPPVGSEPFGLVVSADGKTLFVACSQDASVARVGVASLQVERTVKVGGQPWALGWSAGAKTLRVTDFLGARLTALDPEALEVRAQWTISEVASRGDRRLAQGVSRALYDVAARPGTGEAWVAHSLFNVTTAQPELDFESSVFPALSIFAEPGASPQTISSDAQSVAGVDGAIADVVSGPRALAFTADGRTLLVLDQNSEDVLLVDAQSRRQSSLLRPLPGVLPEGLAISDDGARVFVDERGSGDVAVLSLRGAGANRTLRVDGPVISRWAKDPMPALLRLGQQLFHSANSDRFPLTTNHWVACASCHPEGRSDAVVWRFREGPRDTPSNAGGTRGTGFLLRTGLLTRVEDYWEVINAEQGGHFDPKDPLLTPLLDALAAYVNLAIPFPVPPTTDAARVAQGKEVFERAAVGCVTCHPGPRLTDSGTGNPTLDLGQKVVLHDVGTCAPGDVSHTDALGNPRTGCEFDTPSLLGLAASAPYLHDGSAVTLREVLERTRGKMGDISSLSADELDALVEYLRSL